MKVRPADWPRVKAVFDSALALEGAARAAYVVRACEHDSIVREQVESLLATHDRARTFLEAQGGRLIDPRARTEDELIGTSVGAYQVVSRLGAGGMGEVYLARDDKLDRQVALKLLPVQLTADSDRLRRFHSEARSASALNHPNILVVHDFGEHNGRPFIVTEYIEGKTLRHRIDAGAVPVREAIDIGLQVASALAAAHARDIVHRDVKPENVMIRPDGYVKVLDFGRAKLTSAAASVNPSLTRPGSVLGTPRYMSPEQARGLDLDARTDIWSLGVILYEMVAGHPPFDGATPTDVLAAILRADPAPLDLRAIRAPQAFGRLITRMLTKNVTDRFASVPELRTDLAALKSEIESGTGRQAKTQASATGKAVQPVDTLNVAIAVLPFVNAGRDADIDYLCDGITESVINNLAAIPQLRVVPRSTTFRYKGAEFDPGRAVRELSVGILLTGRILQRHDTLDVQAELVDAVANCQLWGQKYTRKLTDIAAVEQDISREIVRALRIKLNSVEKKRLARRSTQDSEAYQLYLKGRHLWNRRTRPALERAITYFQEAIDKDSEYALAYAGLADCYAVLGSFTFRAPQDVFPQARAAARHAVGIDEALAEAHVSLAIVSVFYEADWETAGHESRRAIAIDPKYALAHHCYGCHLCFIGDFTQGLEELREAQRLEPLSPMINTQLGVGFYLARRYDEAAQVLRNTIEFEPAFWPAHCFLGMVRLQQHDHDRAIAESEVAADLSGRHPMTLAGLGHVLGRAGRREQAALLLEELRTRSQTEYVAPDHLALIHVAAGDEALALEQLQQSVLQHSPFAVWLKTDPRFDGVRSNARFDSLLREVFEKKGRAAHLREQK
jgi:serine/threonine protein kinase/tetratricopeptide (TPR) repeat protein